MRKAGIGAAVAIAITATPMALVAKAAVAAPITRDGSHDLGFNLGTWHTHITRHPDPFADPSTPRLGMPLSSLI
jgi:hypothetical protein